VRIFGFTKRQEDEAESGEQALSEPAAAAASVQDLAASGRRQLLDDISGFLLTNKLDVTPDHLFFAHQAFSGANSELARMLAEQQIARRPVTTEWLAETARSLGVVRDRKGELDKLMKRMEDVLEAFLATSQTASSAASDFGAAMIGHAREAEAEVSGAHEQTALAELARAMIERTRQIEGEMQRAEQEAKALRDRLKRAQRDAELDYLTGLPNRRAFDTIYEREYRDARAKSENLCVAICDIDRFKSVNDTYGHGVGDRVIQAIAKHLKALTNARCHVARQGGEEFVMLFRGVTPEQAAEKLDAARQTFSRKRLINRDTDEPIGFITFSGGVAGVFAYETPSDALTAADTALYAAKGDGRNCIRVAST